MQEARKIIYSPTIHPGSSPAFGGNILGLCWPSISAEHGAACPASQQIVPFKKRHKNLCVVGKTSRGQSQIAKNLGWSNTQKIRTSASGPHCVWHQLQALSPPSVYSLCMDGSILSTWHWQTVPVELRVDQKDARCGIIDLNHWTIDGIPDSDTISMGYQILVGDSCGSSSSASA